MRIHPKHVVGNETRQQLIDAATEVFVEEGFRAARVQDIANAAGVRVSAINYHFGGKRGLYHTVLQYHAERMVEAIPLQSTAPDLPLRQRFDFFVHAVVNRMLDGGSPSHMARLILREASNPTDALELMFGRFIQPQFGVLREILQELLGPNVNSDQIAQAGLGVIGQVIVYVAAQPLVSRFRPEFFGHDDKLEQLADHIAKFSWAGLMALRDSWDTA